VVKGTRVICDVAPGLLYDVVPNNGWQVERDYGRISTVVQLLVPRNLGVINVFGSYDGYRELVQGTDPRFDFLRAGAGQELDLLSKINNDGYLPTPDEAELLSKAIVQKTHEYLAVAHPECLEVSPASDCCFFNYRRGVQ
jgi:hypothetical protein